MAGSVAVLLRCQETGCAVGVTSVGAGLRNGAAFVVGLLAIRHPMTLARVFLDVRAITLAGRRSPSLLRLILRFGSLLLFPRREVEPLLLPLLPLPRRPLLSWTRQRSSRCFEVLGLSEDLLAQVWAAFPPPPAQSQKKEQRLLQLRGQVDSAKARAERLLLIIVRSRKRVLRTETRNWLRLQNWRKSIGCSRMENSRRTRVQLSLLTCLPFASEGDNAMEMEGAPPESSSLPLPSEESAVPTGGQELPDLWRTVVPATVVRACFELL